MDPTSAPASPASPATGSATSLPIDVTVVIPVRNEGARVEAVLGDLLAQDFPVERMEILVVDGASTDDTADRVRRIAARDPRVRLLSNPARLSSPARAIGAAHARGRFVAFVDGHCRVESRRLLADMVALFERSGADALARPQPLVPTGANATARAIALARTSPLGHSGKSEIYGQGERVVSPVSSGAMYRREVFDRVGTFDPAFDAAEDVEFNWRVERAGLRCLTSDALAVRYEPRRTFAALWRQMVRYGVGRARLHRKHPSAFTVETLVPVGFALGLPLLAASPFLARPWSIVFAAPYALYAALAVTAAAFAVRGAPRSLLPRVAFAFPVIHAGLGCGYLKGLTGSFEPSRSDGGRDSRPTVVPASLGDVRAPLYRHVVAPVWARLRGDRSPSKVAAVERCLALDERARRIDTVERLRALLRHARDTVPFHRDRMRAAGFDPDRLRAVEDLAVLPRLTRADLTAHAAGLRSTAYAGRALIEARSGGTTSAAVPFVQTREAVEWKDAAAIALRARMGWTPEARTAWLWGAAQDGPPPTRNPLRLAKGWVSSRLLGRALWLGAGDLSDARLDDHVVRLRRHAPQVLQGYPSAVDLLARRLEARGERLHVPVVVLTAEPVFPEPRERIARALQADVFTFYGARECGWIASEGADHRLRVNTAGVHLERAEDGALLVTDLVNDAMPLIRYEIGDRGTIEAGPALPGDSRPVLAALEGRLTDVFVLPSGRRIPGVVADLRAYRVGLGVLEAQLVQNEPDSLDVRWVAAPNYAPGDEAKMAERLERMFFHELTIRLHRVERLVASPNGKVRYCISNVAAAPALGAPGRAG